MDSKIEKENVLSSEQQPSTNQSIFTSIFNEIFYNPVNLLLTTIIIVLIYKIMKSKYARVAVDETPAGPPLPKLRKDMTAAELKQYDGRQPEGRVLVAVNGFIFDATKGKRFYGPGGPYAAFGGKDASRGLATFSVTSSDKDYDDLSDLNAMEMESVREWEAQFREKYDLVGKLLKPGEEPTSYSDEEAEENETAAPESVKKDE